MKKIFLAMAAGLTAAALTEEQKAAFMQPIKDVLSGEAKPDNYNYSDWLPPLSAQPYLPYLKDAEAKHGLPENLLVRVAYQESRFRDDIISGAVKSSAGAVGIMQIVPKWHPEVNALNVSESIDYAGEYLAKLKRITGSWRMALASYNWGIGNLQRKGFDQAPLETKAYVSEIASDVLVGVA